MNLETEETMNTLSARIRQLLVVSLVVVAVACAEETNSDDAGTGGEPSILPPAGDQTGGAGDMGTGTGTTGPGTETPDTGVGADTTEVAP